MNKTLIAFLIVTAAFGVLAFSGPILAAPQP
jgi:hypothetical protein